MKVTAISLASLTIIIVSLVIGVKNIHHKAGLTTSLVQITSQIALNKRCISLANQYWHNPNIMSDQNRRTLIMQCPIRTVQDEFNRLNNNYLNQVGILP